PLLVAPAHPPNRTALPLNPFDAHRNRRLSVARLVEQSAQAAAGNLARPSRPFRPDRRLSGKGPLPDPALQLAGLDPEPVAEPSRPQLPSGNRAIDSAT